MLVNPGRLPGQNIMGVKPLRGYVTAIMLKPEWRQCSSARKKEKDDPVDYSAGVTLVKNWRQGPGETICILHTNLAEHQEAGFILQNAYSFSDLEPARLLTCMK